MQYVICNGDAEPRERHCGSKVDYAIAYCALVELHGRVSDKAKARGVQSVDIGNGSTKRSCILFHLTSSI